MPFDFLRRKKPTPQPAKRGPDKAVSRPAGPSIAFEGLTEEWRLAGRMYIDARLSDALNKREALPISDVSWAPVDGSSGFSPVPGLRSVDPYDLIVVQAGEGSKPARTEAEEAALRVHKTPYDLTLEAPPLRIVGKVFLTPGTEPRQLLERSTDMFLPVVGGIAYLGDRAVTDPKVEALLVNRFYLRGVEETPAARQPQPAQAQPDRSWPPEPNLRPPPKPPEQKPSQKAPEQKAAPAPKPVETKAAPPQKSAEKKAVPPQRPEAVPQYKAPPEQKAAPPPNPSEQKGAPPQRPPSRESGPPGPPGPPGPAKPAPRKPNHPEKRGWPKET
ncbi:MAG: hypothetical protein M3067_00080 [Chloroflexota bacterium]|nr:hypothetical protein [Chloroflexota bacterium]